MELYICVIVVLSIVVGIPTCIKSMEFILMFKFCRNFDEDENAYIGGTTICEGLTNCCTKSMPSEESGNVEEIPITEQEIVEDDYLDNEAVVRNIEPEVHGKPDSKCMVCCKAFFCCKTANTVTREAEMAQIKLAGATANAAKNADTGVDATQN